MRYFAHIEIEIEAESLDEALEVAQIASDDAKDNQIYNVIDSFVVNVE